MKSVLGFGAAVLLCAVVFFWGPISDSIYNAAQAPRQDRRAVVVTDVTPELEQRLAHPIPSGSVSGSKDGFSWASWHSEENGPYYYRFENLGEKTVYARSRLFSKLLGSTRFSLAPKQVIYFRFVDYGPSTWLTEALDYSEHDSLLASSGTGTSMTLVMPYTCQ